MFLDSDLQFSDSQALTATALSTNVVDLTATLRNIGEGEPVAVVFVVEVAADQGTGDESYTFDVEVASDAAVTTARQLVGRRIFEAGTPAAPAQDADLLVAGFAFVVNVPPLSGGESQRYVAVRYTLAGTTPSVTVSAYLQPMSMIDADKVAQASGYSIT